MQQTKRLDPSGRMLSGAASHVMQQSRRHVNAKCVRCDYETPSMRRRTDELCDARTDELCDAETDELCEPETLRANRCGRQVVREVPPCAVNASRCFTAQCKPAVSYAPQQLRCCRCQHQMRCSTTQYGGGGCLVGRSWARQRRSSFLVSLQKINFAFSKGRLPTKQFRGPRVRGKRCKVRRP